MTRILTAFPYMHSSANGEEHIAGWGIWHDGWNDALLWDGFASEAQAQAAITRLLTTTGWADDWHRPGARDFLNADAFIGGTIDPTEMWFIQTFGHGWSKAPCPDGCVDCSSAEAHPNYTKGN